MSEQLTLRVGLSDHACFENFYSAGNLEVIHGLQRLVQNGRDLVFLIGVSGSGKTHLLYAVQKDAMSNTRRATYLSMSDKYVVEQLSSFLDFGELLCIDDVHCAAGNEHLEKLLFNLIEQQRQLHGGLLLAADQSTRELSWLIPDLASRLQMGTSYQLRSLTDHQKKEALRLRARHRGFDFPEEVIDFVMSRLPRDTKALFNLLDQIDEASLSAQRRVTIPLVKELL